MINITEIAFLSLRAILRHVGSFDLSLGLLAHDAEVSQVKQELVVVLELASGGSYCTTSVMVL